MRTVFADGPADNRAENVRPVPPPGIAVPAATRSDLEKALAELGREMDATRDSMKGKGAELLPDIEIFHKAVRYALQYDEFYRTNEFAIARRLIDHGIERARALREGRAPWNTATGLVVRGYRSKIDGSVQPYGLVVPPSYNPASSHRFRLDFWFHGRGETLTELNFIDQRERSPGEFTPPNAIVLHLYGRYCNANKFAGEIDLFEALADVRRHYPVDENRLVVRGFSMGGAACWQFAAHYSGLWAAAAPGAGFSETADFLKVFQNETVRPAWYEQKLWHWYDATDYAVNLFNCPTVAYSGEIDRQKQAADMMAKALAADGIEMVHIIGPKTAHAYQPEAKEEVNRRIDAIARAGRDPVPRKVRFTTWTLRYNNMLWVTVDGLERHWDRARVDAEILSDHSIRVDTHNVTGLTLSMEPGLCPLDNSVAPTILLDGRGLEAPKPRSDRSWTAHFQRTGRKWKVGEDETELRKQHGLQGPIDDAFLDSFVMVMPTGQPLNSKVGAWVEAEQKHAIEHWRKQFRGDAQVVRDNQVTDELLAGNNLVLWGDPKSNSLLAKIAPHLPIRWTASNILVGSAHYSSDRHVPILIYPNPLNPHRYVVINSGFTFREYDYLNNARQVPKLPDFAVIDVTSPPTSRAPGELVTAGFFGEHWELPETR